MAIGNQPPVLIVEDDLRTRSTLAAIVRFNSYKVLEADDGIEALGILKTSRPQVVISDLQMPLMDGYAFLRILAEYFPEIGAIALSGAFDQEPLGLVSITADAFFAKGSYATKSLLNCVRDLAGLFPLRPLRTPSLLSMVWRPQGLHESLWVACRRCLHCFAWPEAESRPPGIHETSCPSCSAALNCHLEKSARRSSAA